MIFKRHASVKTFELLNLTFFGNFKFEYFRKIETTARLN